MRIKRKVGKPTEPVSTTHLGGSRPHKLKFGIHEVGNRSTETYRRSQRSHNHSGSSTLYACAGKVMPSFSSTPYAIVPRHLQWHHHRLEPNRFCIFYWLGLVINWFSRRCIVVRNPKPSESISKRPAKRKSGSSTKAGHGEVFHPHGMRETSYGLFRMTIFIRNASFKFNKLEIKWVVLKWGNWHFPIKTQIKWVWMWLLCDKNIRKVLHIGNYF